MKTILGVLVLLAGAVSCDSKDALVHPNDSEAGKKLTTSGDSTVTSTGESSAPAVTAPSPGASPLAPGANR